MAAPTLHNHSYLWTKKLKFMSNLTDCKVMRLLEPVQIKKKFQSRAESSSFKQKVPVLGDKFKAMLLDSYPGRLCCRLRHAAPGLEFGNHFLLCCIEETFKSNFNLICFSLFLV